MARVERAAAEPGAGDASQSPAAASTEIRTPLCNLQELMFPPCPGRRARSVRGGPPNALNARLDLAVVSWSLVRHLQGSVGMKRDLDGARVRILVLAGLAMASSAGAG